MHAHPSVWVRLRLTIVTAPSPEIQANLHRSRYKPPPFARFGRQPSKGKKGLGRVRFIPPKSGDVHPSLLADVGTRQSGVVPNGAKMLGPRPLWMAIGHPAFMAACPHKARRLPAPTREGSNAAKTWLATGGRGLSLTGLDRPTAQRRSNREPLRKRPFRQSIPDDSIRPCQV